MSPHTIKGKDEETGEVIHLIISLFVFLCVFSVGFIDSKLFSQFFLFSFPVIMFNWTKERLVIDLTIVTVVLIEIFAFISNGFALTDGMRMTYPLFCGYILISALRE